MCAWKPAPEGSKKREEMPSSCFLEPGQKKYPYKKKVDGKWVATREGLMAAYKRAKQQGDNAVAARALSMLKSKFGYDPDKK
jgi:hypothetical protein